MATFLITALTTGGVGLYCGTIESRDCLNVTPPSIHVMLLYRYCPVYTFTVCSRVSGPAGPEPPSYLPDIPGVKSGRVKVGGLVPGGVAGGESGLPKGGDDGGGDEGGK